MNKKLPLGISLFLLLFCFCISGLTEQLQIGTAYKDQADEVSFIVTLPPGFSPKESDFQLLDGSKVIKKNADGIEAFDNSNKKLILLFSVDVSGSINKVTLKETQDALMDFFKENLPNDNYQFGLVSFADKVKSFPDFANDLDTLEKSISELKMARAHRPINTVLYQSLITSLEQLERLKPNEYRRILVISDGKDEGSKNTSFDDVIDLSKKLGIPIDGFAVGRDRPQFDGTGGLNGLATATGGRFIDTKSDGLSKALDEAHKNLVETTWLVHFKYNRDTTKPAIKNALIKFNPNETVAVFSGDIPAPLDIPTEPKPDDSNNGNKSIEYVVLGILLSITMIFIVWIVRRNQEKPDDSNNEKIEPIIINNKFEEPIKDTDILQSTTKSDSDRRLTAISPDPKFGHSHSNKLSIILEIIEGSQAGQKIPMTKSNFQIGSNQDNDLVLFDNYVSRNHASLSYTNGQLFLTDHSRNGTTVNGVLINNNTSVIAPGDEIRVGNSSLKVIEM